ncbi:MAG: YbaN family protein [Actinobacteria bacterium]|nr:YbaN family protein [Actinomycetota bacterium]
MGNNLNKKEQFLKKPIKVSLITTGTFFIGVGIVGIFLPVLPATPFLLISAALYARSSKRFYNWLINNKIFGRYIKNYIEGKGIPSKLKIITIALLWITIGCSAIFAIDIFWVRVILVIIAIGVTIHIIRIRPKDKSKIGFSD